MVKNMADFCENHKNHGKIMAFDENHGFRVTVIIYCP